MLPACTKTSSWLEERRSPVALTTLQNGGAFAVVHEADGTRHEAGTGGTLGVVLLPLTPQTWGGGTTLGAGHTPAGWTAEVIPPGFWDLMEVNALLPSKLN